MVDLALKYANNFQQSVDKKKKKTKLTLIAQDTKKRSFFCNENNTVFFHEE